MGTNNKNIEKIFVEKLQSMQPIPKEENWHHIKKRLQKRKRERAIAYFSIAAIFLLLMGFSSFFIFNSLNGNKDIVDKITTNRIKNKNKTTEKIFSDKTKNADNTTEKTKEVDDEIVNIKSEKKTVIADKTDKKYVKDNKLQPDNNRKDISQTGKNPSPSSSIAAAKNTDVKQSVKKHKKIHTKKQNVTIVEKKENPAINTQQQFTDVENSDVEEKTASSRKKTLIAEKKQTKKNLRIIEKKADVVGKRKNSILLSLSGQVNSMFSYRRASTVNNTDNSEKGIWNIGGGIKVDIQPFDRIAIRTGVVYGRFGQKTRTLSSTGSSVNRQHSDLNLPNKLSMPNTYITTSAGKVNIGNENTFETTSDVSRIAFSDEEIQQEFESIEIPVAIKYNIVKGKIGMNAIGGMSTNIIIDNNAFIKNKKIGKISDIKNVSLSTDFSILLEYMILDNVKINLEPGMKYYLNNISKNKSVKFKPYSFGVSTGITIDF